MAFTQRLQGDVSTGNGMGVNAFGQEVRIEFCCRNNADGYDCGCGEEW